MKVSEAIEKLTVKRDDALHFQKMYAPGELGWTGNESKAIAYSTAINVLEQLDEPQAEKVEVELTRSQADFMKEHENDSLYKLMRASIPEYEELFARARLNGYTIKPKRWVVKAPNGKYFISLAYGSGIGSLAKCSAKTKDDAYPFDDKSKAEAVATLVEGSVEEV